MYLQQLNLKLEYCPGKENGADYLSHHFLPLTKRDVKSSGSREEVATWVVQSAIPKAQTLAVVQKETVANKLSIDLIALIQVSDERQVKNILSLQPYHQVFHELSIAEGVILSGHQIVIPENLKQHVLVICYDSHLWIIKSK